MLLVAIKVERNTICPRWASGRVITELPFGFYKYCYQILIISLCAGGQKHSNMFVEKLNRFSDPSENALNFLAAIMTQVRWFNERGFCRIHQMPHLPSCIIELRLSMPPLRQKGQMPVRA